MKKALREMQTLLARWLYGSDTARPPARSKLTNTQTGPITIQCAAKPSAQCNNPPLYCCLFAGKLFHQERLCYFSLVNCDYVLCVSLFSCCWFSVYLLKF